MPVEYSKGRWTGSNQRGSACTLPILTFDESPMSPAIPLPTVFLSHGAPTMALQPGKAGPALSALGARLPRPDAILIVSPHWDTPTAQVSAVSQPETIHDFFGFPAPLYELRYPAPGAPRLAQQVCVLLTRAGIECALDASRGLDHGAWSPLRFLYPEADIPVTQLSLQSHLPPSEQYRIGQALASLPAENVLIIGSGSMTHNLGEFRGGRQDGAPQPYVMEFQNWFAAHLAQGDVPALLDYRARAPHAVRAHPTDDHLLPLFVALGAAGSQSGAKRLIDEVTYGMLAMDAYLFGP